MIFNKTIIPLALVGYEMMIANLALCASLAITSYPTRARGIIVNYNYKIRVNFSLEYHDNFCYYVY